MKILVCGGAGFIGSAFIRNYLDNHPKDKIINLTYANDLNIRLMLLGSLIIVDIKKIIQKNSKELNKNLN